jgi:DNA-binding response OmpR family regulator
VCYHRLKVELGMPVCAMAFTILLIDDSDVTQRLFRVVADYNDLALTVVKDAESAFNYLEARLPDVVVVDLYLFEPDGFQILEQIRRNEDWARCRVVATTSFYTSQTAVNVLLSGFDGYLPKPFVVTDLVPYLRQVAEKE